MVDFALVLMPVTLLEVGKLIRSAVVARHPMRNEVIHGNVHVGGF